MKLYTNLNAESYNLWNEQNVLCKKRALNETDGMFIESPMISNLANNDHITVLNKYLFPKLEYDSEDIRTIYRNRYAIYMSSGLI